MLRRRLWAGPRDLRAVQCGCVGASAYCAVYCLQRRCIASAVERLCRRCVVLLFGDARAWAGVHVTVCVVHVTAWWVHVTGIFAHARDGVCFTGRGSVYRAAVHGCCTGLLYARLLYTGLAQGLHDSRLHTRTVVLCTCGWHVTM